MEESEEGSTADPEANLQARELAIQLYDELRGLAAARMKKERPDHTLSPTALVHEVWLRVQGDRPAGWGNRAQFFSAAAIAMRRILVERARAKAREKRGGERRRVSLTQVGRSFDSSPEQVLALDEALERLRALDPRSAEVARLRVFVDLPEAEIAAILSISERTVRRDWRFARAFLVEALGEEEKT